MMPRHLSRRSRSVRRLLRGLAPQIARWGRSGCARAWARGVGLPAIAVRVWGLKGVPAVGVGMQKWAGRVRGGAGQAVPDSSQTHRAPVAEVQV